MRKMNIKIFIKGVEMKNLKLFLFFSFFITPLLAKEKVDSKMVYIYQREIKGKNSKTTWTVEEKGQKLHIQGLSDSGKTVVITALPLNTKSFSYQSKKEKNAYQIDRNGPFLCAKRTENGHTMQKKFNIGNDFWIQEFDFSMRAFILSKADSLKFYTVHPTRLSLHHMVATKSSKVEKVVIRDHSYETVQVRVTLIGIKKMLWKAELWFDLKTGDLLRYRANEGPNTPTSVISLFSKTKHKSQTQGLAL